MSVTFFSENLLEAATVTVAPTPDNVARLYDRDRSLQVTAAPDWSRLLPLVIGWTKADMVIDVDLGASPAAATAWALVNHTASGTVTIKADNTSPPTTTIDTHTAVSGTDFLRTFASQTKRYWRVTIPGDSVIGELMLGVPFTITLNPYIESGGRITVGNVKRWRSPGGFPWAARLGSKRARIEWRWTTLADADLTTLRDVFDDIEQGEKNLLVQDPDATLRWMSMLNERLEPVPVGGGLNEIAVELEEAL